MNRKNKNRNGYEKVAKKIEECKINQKIIAT